MNNDSKKQTSIDDISGATVFYYIPSKEKAAEIKLMMTGKKIDPYKTSNDRNARLIKMSFIDSASGISLDFTYGSTIVYSGFFDRTGKPANSLQALVESQLPKKLQLIQNKKEMLWYSTNNLGCRFLP